MRAESHDLRSRFLHEKYLMKLGFVFSVCICIHLLGISVFFFIFHACCFGSRLLIFIMRNIFLFEQKLTDMHNNRILNLHFFISPSKSNTAVIFIFYFFYIL